MQCENGSPRVPRSLGKSSPCLCSDDRGHVQSTQLCPVAWVCARGAGGAHVRVLPGTWDVGRGWRCVLTVLGPEPAFGPPC